MAIRVNTYGGRLGWAARKVVPRLSSYAFTKLHFMLRRKESYRYIESFFLNMPHPLSVNIETIIVTRYPKKAG